MNSQNRGRKTPQTRKANIMKKSTLAYIAATLSTIDFENKANVIDEINAELNRGMEKRQAKIAEYAENRAAILGGLSDTPVTVAELYETIKPELTEGFTRAKLQYALVNFYKDEVVKIGGSPNTYKKA